MFFSVFHSLLLCILLISMVAGFVQWRVKGILPITGILLTNLITEFYVEHILIKGEYNHYVYAINNLIVSGLVLAFFRTFVSSFILNSLFICVFGLFSYQYVTKRMWEHGLVIPVRQIAIYYSLMALSSLMFIWKVITTEKVRESYVMRFAVCFLLYYLLAFLNFSPEFAMLLNPADEVYFFWAFNLLNFIYFSAIGLLLIQIKVTGGKHVR